MGPLQQLLKNNAYPGRGIVLGLAEDGACAAAYFIMGRSANSRNRVFTLREGDVFSEAADEAQVQDPRLILYRAAHRLGDGRTIVGNGTQTDAVAAALARGGSFEEALRTCTFEPDAPVFTPRITGLLHHGPGGFWYQLSLVKSEGAGQSVRRFFYEYPQPLLGGGHFLHTYASPEGGLPSFMGEPAPVRIDGDADAWGRKIWQALNEENKVALFVRTIAPGGQEETRIYNKYTRC